MRVSMRAKAVLRSGSWDANRQVDAVLLDFDLRHRRRFMLRTEAGADLLLDLPAPVRLRDGDGLAIDGDGGMVLVRAAAEPLLEVRAPGQEALLRIAWHLGNRHLPLQVSGDCLLVRDDHVIAELVEYLGGHVARLAAPFEPEAGAYAAEPHVHDH